MEFFDRVVSSLSFHYFQNPLFYKHNDKDHMVWPTSSSGFLSLNDAYTLKAPPSLRTTWSRDLQCIKIPPSKSLMVWKLINNKVPTDEQLMYKGVH